METYNIMNKRSIIVEYEFHYGFLLLMIKSLNFRGYDVDVYCTRNFLAYCKIKKIDKKKINFICEDSVAYGTYRAILDSKNVEIFLHFSVQAYKYATFIRLLKPKAKYNILYTPRFSNWHNQYIRFSLNKKNIIENYFNIFRYFIKKNYDFYIVHSAQMANDIFAKTNYYPIVLPYTCREYIKYEDIQKNKDSNKLRITILGSVDEMRRDYLSIFNSKLISNYNLSDIEFELAGVPNGSDYSSNTTSDNYFNLLKTELKKIEKKTGCSVITYDKRLDETQYIKSIKTADLLLMPLNISHYPKGSWSAGLAESIEHDKRILIPKGYDIPEGYPNDYIIYDCTKNLIEKLQDIKTNKSVCLLSDQETMNRKNSYELKNISERFFNALYS